MSTESHQVAEQHVAQAQPKRSKRMYILWAIALTLLISTALFCWLVVVPFWRVKEVMDRWGKIAVPSKGVSEKLAELHPKDVDALGGPRSAVRHIRIYLKAPRSVAPYRMAASYFLAYCARSPIRIDREGFMIPGHPTGNTRVICGIPGTVTVISLDRLVRAAIILSHGTYCTGGCPWSSASRHAARSAFDAGVLLGRRPEGIPGVNGRQC